jgi:xanthine dehydrogenase accessory factor
VNRQTLTRLQSLRRAGEPVALVTRLADGEQALVTRGGCEGALEIDSEVAESARERIREDRSGRLENRHEDLFVRVYNRPLRLILTGAVHISQALIPIATILGFEVIVIDPRTAFATDERFPSVKLITEWPDAAMRALKPDSRTAVVTLTHDPKIDDPALRVALASDAFFVGALGSRKTHAARVDRLRAEGIADPDIARIHAPVGVPLGGRRPAEIALSVMAEIIRTLRAGAAA